MALLKFHSRAPRTGVIVGCCCGGQEPNSGVLREQQALFLCYFLRLYHIHIISPFLLLPPNPPYSLLNLWPLFFFINCHYLHKFIPKCINTACSACIMLLVWVLSMWCWITCGCALAWRRLFLMLSASLSCLWFSVQGWSLPGGLHYLPVACLLWLSLANPLGCWAASVAPVAPSWPDTASLKKMTVVCLRGRYCTPPSKKKAQSKLHTQNSADNNNTTMGLVMPTFNLNTQETVQVDLLWVWSQPGLCGKF